MLVKFKLSKSERSTRWKGEGEIVHNQRLLSTLLRGKEIPGWWAHAALNLCLCGATIIHFILLTAFRLFS